MKPLARLALSLKPLTPIHVWRGVDAVAGLDLVFRRGGKACLVDFEGLPSDLVSLVVEKGMDLESLVSRYADRLPCREEFEAPTTLPRGSTVKLMNQMGIPGTEVKGYIRTAIMNHILRRLDKGIVKQMLSQVSIEDYKNAGLSLEAQLFRAPRLRRQGGFVDSFQMLHVSDPLRTAGLMYRIARLLVYSLSSGRVVATMNLVALVLGELQYTLTLLKSVDTDMIAGQVQGLNTILNRLSRLGNEAAKEGLDAADWLRGVLREFGCLLIEHEEERLSRARGVDVDRYRELLGKLRDRYCSRDGDCVVARIGFATGYPAKTVLLLIKEVDPEFYRLVSSTMSMRLRRPWDDLSLKLVEHDGRLVGMGWCELCLRSMEG